jgi:hypothetical protein
MHGVVLVSLGTMNRSKRLTGVCSECGGSIEFMAELIGTMTQCPRCRKQTELTLAVPAEEPAVPRRIIVLTVVAIVVLVLALIVTVVGLKHYSKLAVHQRERAAAAAGTNGTAMAAGFEVSNFSLEKGQGSNGLYAVGTVENTANRPRTQVTLELNLIDAGGQEVGIAKAYRPLLGPRAKWQVKVPVAGAPGAASAKVASIKEGQ